MRTVGLGIQAFETIREDGLFYVDKTDFISRWFRKKDAVTLITRPRRFGKTLTMDMLNCFFSTEYAGRAELFEGLDISRDEGMMALQGTIPTIRISFAGVKGDSFKGFLTATAGRIARVLRRYRFLLEGNVLTEDDKKLFLAMSKAVPQIPNRETEEEKYLGFIYGLTHIFSILSGWLYDFYGKKTYIFMDEYDTPLEAAYRNGYYDEAIPVMREMFSETFKENEYLSRAVITGITRIAKESLFSDMNNLAVCTVISGGYDRSFGFTQEEMDRILEEYGIMDKKDLLRHWYDGFTIGEETGIYNPWSVVNYLENRTNSPQDYWAKSGGMGLVDHLIRRGSPQLKEGFEILLGGGVIRRRIRDDLIFPWLDRDENAVWSLLIAAGYVKPLPGASENKGLLPGVSENKNLLPGTSGERADVRKQFLEALEREKLPLTLTNYESLLSLSEMVNGWFTTQSGNFMEQFANALLSDDLLGMNETMQQVVLLCVSGFDSGIKPSQGRVQPENFFHALTLGMLTCLSGTFRVRSNRESGFGRYDVSVEPLDASKTGFAAVLEFKVFDRRKGDRSVEDAARRARRQIDEKAYDFELFNSGISQNIIRKYGFGFCGKEVVVVK